MNRRAFAGAFVCGVSVRSLGAVPLLRVRTKDKVESVDLEQYTRAVLTGESSVFRSDEALKAMAVTVRTYAMRFRGRHDAEGFDLCDTTHCQRFDSTPASARVITAARETTGELLQHTGRPALAYYSLDCGGHTEDVRQVWPDDAAPYLRSHVDPYCRRGGTGKWHWEASATKLVEALQMAGLRSPGTIRHLSVVERARVSTRVKVLDLGESVRISASSLRFAVGRAYGFNTVQSDLYQVGMSSGRVVFDGVGVGHGVGLCQRGADQMGVEGRSYREILEFYFPGTASGGSAAEKLVWRRVAGERIGLFTTQPDRDGAVLVIAEQLLREAESRARITAPGGIELRTYPDLASYMDATGEPGWVAARISGREIQLQPLQVLRGRGALERTLRHELTHLLIESKARNGLPVWFREGLTEYLSTAARAEAASSSTKDRDLRQTADEARARIAYEQARRQVSALVSRYGETAVLSWLTTGLPREAMNANSRQPAMKSK